MTQTVDKKNWSKLRKDDIVQLIDNGVNFVFDHKNISLSDVQRFLGDNDNVEVEDQKIKERISKQIVVFNFDGNKYGYEIIDNVKTTETTEKVDKTETNISGISTQATEVKEEVDIEDSLYFMMDSMVSTQKG